MKVSKHILLIILVLNGFSLADNVNAAEPEWMRKRTVLKERYIKDEFRIFYNLSGESALTSEEADDSNTNGVPDKIENIALQLVAARRMYVEVFKLRHPFQSLRYAGKVKIFDVHVTTLSVNGSAGDEIVNYHRRSDPPGGYNVLSMDISKRIPTTNLTPAHELFHQFQNGYTRFKNHWFTEGTAAWAEYAFNKLTGAARSLPMTERDKATLLNLAPSSAYTARTFWNALVKGNDKVDNFYLSGDLANARYIGSGEFIIQDQRLYGFEFMKILFEELDAADNRVSGREGLDPLNWEEHRQKSTVNNEEIWNAIVKVSAINPIADPNISTTDAFFNWAERQYPQYFPQHQASQNISGFYARYYPSTNTYLGTKNGRVYVNGTQFGGLLDLGELGTWLQQAGIN